MTHKDTQVEDTNQGNIANLLANISNQAVSEIVEYLKDTLQVSQFCKLARILYEADLVDRELVWYDMCEFETLVKDYSKWEVACIISNGDNFNPYDDFIKIDEYGSLISGSDWTVECDMLGNESYIILTTLRNWNLIEYEIPEHLRIIIEDAIKEIA